MMRRVPELDGLRAVAVFFVIGCHYPGFATLAGGVPEFGWVGVDIFFVLSGYLITTILLGLRDRPSPYRNFYGRRVIRIFPPYIIVTLFIFVLAVCTHADEILNAAYVLKQIFFLQSFDPRVLPFISAALHHLPWNLLHLPSLRFFAGHLPFSWIGTPTALNSPSATFWSLSIEEYFYLFWAPIVLLLPRRVIPAIALAICVGEILLRWITGASVWYFCQFSIYYHLDPLLYGALVALLLAFWSRYGVPGWGLRALRITLAASTAAIGCCLLIIRPVLGREVRASTLVLVVAMPAFCVAVACLIGLLVLQTSKPKTWMLLLRARPMQALGVMSYSMYLTHILAAAFIAWGAARLHLAGRFAFLQAVLSLLLTIGIARASWHWLEKPLLRWKDRFLPSEAHPPEPTLN